MPAQPGVHAAGTRLPRTRLHLEQQLVQQGDSADEHLYCAVHAAHVRRHCGSWGQMGKRSNGGWASAQLRAWACRATLAALSRTAPQASGTAPHVGWCQRLLRWAGSWPPGPRQCAPPPRSAWGGGGRGAGTGWTGCGEGTWATRPLQVRPARKARSPAEATDRAVTQQARGEGATEPAGMKQSDTWVAQPGASVSNPELGTSGVWPHPHPPQHPPQCPLQHCFHHAPQHTPLL